MRLLNLTYCQPEIQGAVAEHDEGSVFFDDEISAQFFDIIKSAKESIVIVTPFVRLWEHLKTAIAKAVEKGVEVTFIIREKQNHRTQEEERRFNEDTKWLKDHNVKLIPFANLHAKIYLNESKVLISSMNVHRTSVEDSKEFAMIVSSEPNKQMLRAYVSELIPKPVSLKGHCIRCDTEVPYNTDKPFCPSHWREWSRYHNYKYEEKFCHSCGKGAKTTINLPLCRDCWTKSRQSI